MDFGFRISELILYLVYSCPERNRYLYYAINVYENVIKVYYIQKYT